MKERFFQVVDERESGGVLVSNELIDGGYVRLLGVKATVVYVALLRFKTDKVLKSRLGFSGANITAALKKLEKYKLIRFVFERNLYGGDEEFIDILDPSEWRRCGNGKKI